MEKYKITKKTKYSILLFLLLGLTTILIQQGCAKGDKGENGASGDPVVGAAGVNGTTGANGADGATGSTGAAGANGTNGATGSTGATGANGAAGASSALFKESNNELYGWYSYIGFGTFPSGYLITLPTGGHYYVGEKFSSVRIPGYLGFLSDEGLFEIDNSNPTGGTYVSSSALCFFNNTSCLGQCGFVRKPSKNAITREYDSSGNMVYRKSNGSADPMVIFDVAQSGSYRRSNGSCQLYTGTNNSFNRALIQISGTYVPTTDLANPGSVFISATGAQ